MKIIKREVVYSSFLFISVFINFSFFSLSIPQQSITKKITLIDFHQKVTFEFMFLCTKCLSACLFFFVFFFVFFF